jgi:hypothetical protein
VSREHSRDSRLGGALPLHLGDVHQSARGVQREIERVGSKARVPYMDVVGHSLDGLVATYLLKALDGGRRVRRCSPSSRGSRFPSARS